MSLSMGIDPGNLVDRGPTWHQVLSNWQKSDTNLSFHSDYPNSEPYEFDFVGISADGGQTYTGTGTDPGGSWPATMTFLSDTTTDYNHGEYVAASIEEYGSPDAHSCIGMPKVSKR